MYWPTRLAGIRTTRQTNKIFLIGTMAQEYTICLVICLRWGKIVGYPDDGDRAVPTTASRSSADLDLDVDLDLD